MVRDPETVPAYIASLIVAITSYEPASEGAVLDPLYVATTARSAGSVALSSALGWLSKTTWVAL